jgi:hypothetical protein
MQQFLGAYCERAGQSGLLAEPLNLATNAAFLLAAWLAWRRFAAWPAMRLPRDLDIAALIAIVFGIGIGSASWHAHPVRATLLADVLPITLFIHLYLVIFVVRVLGLRWYWAGAILAAFIAAGFGLPSLFGAGGGGSGGTSAYLPAYAMLAIMTVVVLVTRNPAAPGLALVLGIWTVSLAARSVDGAVCEAFPWGTHFVWHTLNAAVLFGLTALLVRHADVRHGEVRRAGGAG